MIYFDTHIHVDLFKERHKMLELLNNSMVYSIAVTNLPLIFQNNKLRIPETKYLKHALGYHPELVEEYPDLLPVFRREIRNTRYIGEIGIDGSFKNKNSLVKQEEIFSSIIMECNTIGGKILTVHSRKAEKRVLEILDRQLNCKVILHWFSGNKNQVQIGKERGYYFSINPRMLTTKGGRELILIVPLNQLLVESDSPFGVCEREMNYPKIFSIIVKEISGIKKISPELVINQLEKNFRELIKIL